MPQFTPRRQKKACPCLVLYSSWLLLVPFPNNYPGILNNTKTTLGRSLMRTWLLRPSLSLSVINSRHEAVACFMSSENVATAIVMHGHLNGIKNVPRILSVLKAGRAKLSDWQGLVKVWFCFWSTYVIWHTWPSLLFTRLCSEMPWVNFTRQAT